MCIHLGETVAYAYEISRVRNMGDSYNDSRPMTRFCRDEHIGTTVKDSKRKPVCAGNNESLLNIHESLTAA